IVGFGPNGSQAQVPSVVGLTVPQATQKLQAAGLTLHVTGPSPAGATVKSQQPAAGAQASSGGKVEVQLQAKKVTVPPLVGLTHQEAQEKVKKAGLVLEVKAGPGPSAGATVKSQHPTAGAQVNAGSKVTAELAAKKVHVPPVEKMTYAQAKQALQS